MTKIISKYTAKFAPYVPVAIKDNWITIMSIIFVAWFTYTSVLLYNTAHEAKSASKSAQHLAAENQLRIKEIQKQRVRSCQLTYQSFYDVFKPFFLPPDKQTPQQEQFIANLKAKKRGCSKQVLRKPRKINQSKLRIH